MKEIITTGKTVELAIEEACQQMNVSREKVEFEIIDLPKKALFGLKTYPAKVRVFVMLVVTHEMGFARNVSSKTVFMENGVVVEQAPSHEFFAHPREERTREFLRKIEHTA